MPLKCEIGFGGHGKVVGSCLVCGKDTAIDIVLRLRLRSCINPKAVFTCSPAIKRLLSAKIAKSIYKKSLSKEKKQPNVRPKH